MPLLDHFHPPLLGVRRWESLHAFWSGAIAERLNLELLPPGFYAEIQAHVGNRVEVDVGAFDRDELTTWGSRAEPSNGGVATLEAVPRVWSPPSPDLSFPAIYPDVFEVLVYKEQGGSVLVGAIELVSPGNKDRPEARRAFAAKCSSYLQAGVGLVVVDVVTNRLANLHDELVDWLGLGEPARMVGGPPIYATAYHPIRRKGEDTIDAWRNPLIVGGSLSVVPLALRGGPCLPLDLEVTYADLCRRARLA